MAKTRISTVKLFVDTKTLQTVGSCLKQQGHSASIQSLNIIDISVNAGSISSSEKVSNRRLSKTTPHNEKSPSFCVVVRVASWTATHRRHNEEKETSQTIEATACTHGGPDFTKTCKPMLACVHADY